MDYKISQLGDNALTISFGNVISRETNDRVFHLAERIRNEAFYGFVEAVSAYSSLSIFYDLVKVRRNYADFHTAFEFVKDFAENGIESLTNSPRSKPRTIEIPVSFAKDSALDLEMLAEAKSLSTQEVIEIFSAQTYRVFMLGFLPGFAYMGEVDSRIAMPRIESPRLKVPKGSVGIAGNQTGIYPLESPGGWNIIGKTDVEMFTRNEDNPTFLRAGDLVRFVSI